MPPSPGPAFRLRLGLGAKPLGLGRCFILKDWEPGLLPPDNWRAATSAPARGEPRLGSAPEPF
jgi:hypothetical protein